MRMGGGPARERMRWFVKSRTTTDSVAEKLLSGERLVGLAAGGVGCPQGRLGTICDNAAKNVNNGDEWPPRQTIRNGIMGEEGWQRKKEGATEQGSTVEKRKPVAV